MAPEVSVLKLLTLFQNRFGFPGNHLASENHVPPAANKVPHLHHSRLSNALSVLGESRQVSTKLYGPTQGTRISLSGFQPVKWPTSTHQLIQEHPKRRREESNKKNVCLSLGHFRFHSIPLHEHLRRARHCSRHWVFHSEQTLSF